MRHITHAKYRSDYINGYNAKLAEIHTAGWEAARDKFNLDCPIGSKPQNLGAYYYAEGEIDALADEI